MFRASRRAGAAAVVILFLAPAPGAAQTDPVTGQRIRVSTVRNIVTSDIVRLIDPALDIESAQVADGLIEIRLRQRAGVLRVIRPGRRLVGDVAGIDVAAMTLTTTSRALTVVVPRSTVATIERSDGKRSRLRKAALWALAGFGAGALAGLMAESDCGSGRGFEICLPGLAAIVGGSIGGAGGFAFGLALPPGERWRPLSPGG